ncbi:MAG TPA: hypothetical protein VJL90_04565 [Pseudorhodoplanes sp.]|nr:hypothetical protein [Pseudorhodoplanes sp.]
MTATMGGAWAQVVSPQTTSQSANSEIGKTADEARDAAKKGNCIRFNILRNRLKAFRQNTNDPFWARHDMASPGTANLLIINTNRRLDQAITQLDQIECKKPAQQQAALSSEDVQSVHSRFTDGLEAGGNNQCVRLNLRIRELERIANDPSVAEDVRRRAQYYAKDLREGGCPRFLGTMVPHMVLPQDYDIPASTQTGRVEVQMSGGGQVIRLPRRFFLGTEVGGVPNVFFFNPDREATGGSASGSVKVNLGPDSFFGPINVHELRFGAFYAESKVDQSGITLDPGAGVTLLIPGPNGGASGFALGANPLNIVRDGTYSAELVKAGGRVDLGFGGLLANGWDFYMAFGYKHISFDERFAGSIPGFARNFAYVSNVDVDQFNTRVGVATRFTLANANGLKTTLGGMFEAGADFSSAGGSDRLSFTGFSDSIRPLDASKTQFGFSTGLNLNFQTATGLNFGVDGRYMREAGLPVLVRDGNNPTALKLEDGDGWVARGYVRLNLPPKP